MIFFFTLPLLWMKLQFMNRLCNQPMLLIAPFWPNRPWFCLLLILLTDLTLGTGGHTVSHCS